MSHRPSAPAHAAQPTSRPVVAVLRSRVMRRLLIAFLIFNSAEWAIWIAILVWAFGTGGAAAAGLISVVQLVPATLLAPFAATIGDRVRRDYALALGYSIQALTMALVGFALLFDAPVPVIYVLAALASSAIVLTRPVHHAIIPEAARTPAEITAANAASSTAEAIAVIVGPLFTGIALEVAGPSTVFFTTAGLSVVSVLLTRALPLRRTFERDDNPENILKATMSGVSELRSNTGAVLLTLIVGAQFVVVGLLDILGVVLGIQLLDMGPSGPGILTAAIGAGGIVGAALSVVVVGRRRLSPVILAGVLFTGIPVGLVALATLPPPALVLLGFSGLGKALVDVSGLTLLQRSVRPNVLARVFGVQESLRMAGTAVGSAVAPLLVILLSPRGAFVAAGIFLPAVGVLFLGRIRHLDVRSMQPGPGFALLETIPLFAMMPRGTREQISRELIPLAVTAGEDILVEGDESDRFYVVAGGTVDIIKSGRVVATTTTGGYFGEIALLRDVPRTATVRAEDDVSLYALERRTFLEAVTGSSKAHELAHQEAERRLGNT